MGNLANFSDMHSGSNEKMTSLTLAELTGKPHSDLMKSIRRMESAWEKVNQGKFSLVDYKDAKGEIRPMYELSKTECLFIATKFNDDARAKVILRWETLENERMNALSIFQNDPFIQLRMNQIQQQQQIQALESKVNMIEAKTITRPDYFSVMGYAIMNKVTVGLRMAASIGKKASSICKKNGFPTDEVPDPRFGRVKLYPSSVLDKVFSETVFS